MDDLLNYCLIDGCVTEFFDFLASVVEPEMMLEHEIIGSVIGFGAKVIIRQVPVNEASVMKYLTV